MSGHRLLKKLYWVGGVTLLGLAVTVNCAGDQGASDSQIEALDGGGAAKDDSVGANADYSTNAQVARERTFIKESDIDEKILEDLRSLDRRTANRTRYLTLTHLYNSGVSERTLDVFRVGLAKMVNHLSYAREIKIPEAIDTEKTIYRFELDDYRWSRNTWSEVARRYPYQLFRRTQTERDIINLTQTSVPRVKADWFTNETGKGNLYYFIMRIFGNVRNLEFQLLGTSGDNNVRRGQVERAASVFSNVSAHNRMVERHEQRNGGYYYKSYDFEAPNGRAQRNIFEFPLDANNFRVTGFNHAGGEMIYSLPNGLQGYVLTEANGDLLNVAPVSIVQDRRRAVLGTAEVANGVACIGCHVRGMKKINDQLRAHVEKNSFAFDRFTLDFTRRIYPGNERFQANYKKDEDAFAEAVKKLNWDVRKPEPTVPLANRYDDGLSVELMAAELGLEPADFLEKLQRSRFLSRRFGQTANKGFVQRPVFEENFFNLTRVLGLGDSRFGRRGGGGFYSAEGGEYAHEAPPEDPKAPIRPENFEAAPEIELVPKPGPTDGSGEIEDEGAIPGFHTADAVEGDEEGDIKITYDL